MSTICVIDDDPEVCDLLRLTFETRGYRVVQAWNGREGLELIRTARPDIVVLDIQMPEANGYEVLAAVRQDPAIAATPIVVVTCITAGSGIGEAQWKQRLGVEDFLAKPFDPLDLLARVKSILESRAPQPPAS